MNTKASLSSRSLLSPLLLLLSLSLSCLQIPSVYSYNQYEDNTPSSRNENSHDLNSDSGFKYLYRSLKDVDGDEHEGENGNDYCSSYTNTINIPNGKIEYFSTETTISMKMSSPTNNIYLALGISDDGRMKNSEAIVGDGFLGIRYYSLQNGMAIDNIIDESRQTAAIEGATFHQDDNGSVLTFKKLLDDGTGNKVIDGNGGKNIFIWAMGNTNNIYGGHGGRRGQVEIILSPCSKNEEKQSTATVTVTTVTEKNHMKLFLMHGIFAILAFGVCMPIAIIAAAARNLSFMKDGLWFKIHSSTMVLAFVFCVALFFLAVNAVSQRGSTHFQNRHERVGLVTILLTTIQVVFAIVRPSSPHPRPTSSEVKELTDAGDDNNYDSDHNDFGGNYINDVQREESSTNGSNYLKTALLRSTWEKSHRFLAFMILVFGLYQIYSGYAIYYGIYESTDYLSLFWASSVLMTILPCGIVVYSKQKAN